MSSVIDHYIFIKEMKYDYKDKQIPLYEGQNWKTDKLQNPKRMKIFLHRTSLSSLCVLSCNASRSRLSNAASSNKPTSRNLLQSSIFSVLPIFPLSLNKPVGGGGGGASSIRATNLLLPVRLGVRASLLGVLEGPAHCRWGVNIVASNFGLNLEISFDSRIISMKP